MCGIPGIEALILKSQLHWVGHIIHMPDSHIPKQIFFGQLATGKRPQSGPVRRFKDVIKSHMKWCEINAADLCSASLSRTSWHTLCHKAATKFEDGRLSALEHRRAAVRKFGTQPLNNPSAWPCSSCSRICNSRIGLYTHEQTHRWQEAICRSDGTVQNRTSIFSILFNHSDHAECRAVLMSKVFNVKSHLFILITD